MHHITNVLSNAPWTFVCAIIKNLAHPYRFLFFYLFFIFNVRNDIWGQHCGFQLSTSLLGAMFCSFTILHGTPNWSFQVSIGPPLSSLLQHFNPFCRCYLLATCLHLFKWHSLSLFPVTAPLRCPLVYWFLFPFFSPFFSRYSAHALSWCFFACHLISIQVPMGLLPCVIL